MKKITACILLAVALFAGCAMPPNQELTQTLAILSQRGIDITQEPYASALNNINNEIQIQQDRFFKNYDRSKDMIKALSVMQPGLQSEARGNDTSYNINSGTIDRNNYFTTHVLESGGHTYIVVTSGHGIAIVHAAGCKL